MITVFYSSETLEVTKSADVPNIYDYIKRRSWIHLTSPTEEEILKVAEITKIPDQMIRIPLDEEESAHIDLDDDVMMIVVDMPFLEPEENYPEINKYLTTPFGILYNEEYFVTTCLKTGSIITSFAGRWMKNFSTNKHIKLSIQLLYRNASTYVSLLKLLDKDSEFVQKKLHESLKNKELFQLMSLGKSLVYLSTGANSDGLVLEKLKRLEQFRKYDEDLELIEDAIIENRQAMEMCTIHRDILNGTMDAFASVISNNVNTVMKTLTVVTIVLTIPTLIASFFGMNVKVPWEGNTVGFWLAIAISIIISFFSALFLIKYTSKVKDSKKNYRRKRRIKK
ncbi:MAG: magnesium transporter CorA family protein [Bacilli bacterium]